MKISNKCAFAALAIIGAASAASAQQVTFTNGVKPANFNGGEFIGTYSGGELGGRSFGGFCLEILEYITLDTGVYGYEVVSPSDGAIGGNINNGPASPTGGDAISNQTGWLFVQWATNRSALNTIMGTSLSNEEVARRVQWAIWELEDEGTAPAGLSGNVSALIAQATSAVGGVSKHAAFDPSLNPAFSKLRVVNPFDGTLANRGTERQSQIILIPLPTASGMALAGLALVGGIRRRK